MKNAPQILECTLRDGSYAIGFQFTAHETGVLCSSLDQLGFEWIEIGHGLGLNASASGKGTAASTDEEYLAVAADKIKKAKWGMFFIPGIGRLHDLDLAKEHGMDFVRIGTNASELASAKESIAHAKDLGFMVASNLMKSYILSPSELADQASVAESYGADLFYIVDSAGKMLPVEVGEYCRAAKDRITIPVGFHGHDNLSLGIANCITAVNHGIDFLDCTLQGMGRGGGNPSTEVLLTVLKRMGITYGIDIHDVMDASAQFIQPLLRTKGTDSLTITAGYAGFHSSFLNMVLNASDKHEIDPRDLIEAACEEEQADLAIDKVEEIAQALSGKIKKKRLFPSGLGSFVINAPQVESQKSDILSSIQTLANQVHSLSLKKGKKSVVNFVVSMKENDPTSISRFVQETDYIIGSVQSSTIDILYEMANAIDGICDILLVDSDQKVFVENNLCERLQSEITQSMLIRYSDTDVLARCIIDEVRILLNKPELAKVVVGGSNRLAIRIVDSLLSIGIPVVLTANNQSELNKVSSSISALMQDSSALAIEANPHHALGECNLFIVADSELLVKDSCMIDSMSQEGIILDCMISGVTDRVIRICDSKKIKILRPDMRATLSSELRSILGVSDILTEMQGRRKYKGFHLIAGGLVGKEGDIVVDSISNPTTFIGLADGRGRVMYPDAKRAKEIVEQIDSIELPRKRNTDV